MRILEVRMGAPLHIAEATTSALIYASLRGVESHGIGLLSGYVKQWEQGRIVPDAEPKELKETKTTILLDAHQTLGHYASLKAADNAVEKAQNTGVGTAVIRNSNHNGGAKDRRTVYIRVRAYTTQCDAQRATLYSIQHTALCTITQHAAAHAERYRRLPFPPFHHGCRGRGGGGG